MAIVVAIAAGALFAKTFCDGVTSTLNSSSKGKQLFAEVSDGDCCW
jgi:hypothetical protein